MSQGTVTSILRDPRTFSSMPMIISSYVPSSPLTSLRLMTNSSPPTYRVSGTVMVTSMSPFSRSTEMRLMYTVPSVLRTTVSSSDAMTSMVPSEGLRLMQ